MTRRSIRRVVLVGPPGSGKTTQARAVSDKLGAPHVCIGELFRSNIARGTPLGMASRSYLDRGELVPDEWTTEIVRQRLAEPDAAGGFLVDGFPRTAHQARSLTEALNDAGTPVDLVVETLLERDEAALRLAGRRSCGSCGRIWHVRFNPPAVYGICDDCASSLVRRDDDDPIAIHRRLDVYDRETAPLLDFYRQQGILEAIEASGTVEHVAERMASALCA